jgi:hypothetical protein
MYRTGIVLYRTGLNRLYVTNSHQHAEQEVSFDDQLTRRICTLSTHHDVEMKRQRRFIIKASSCFALFSSIHSSAFTSTSTKRYVHDIAHQQVHHAPRASPSSSSKIDDDISIFQDNNIMIQRRIFLSQLSIATAAFFARPSHAVTKDSADERSDIMTYAEKPVHSAAYGQEEYTNSIVASRDTNISPREVYDTITSDYLKNVLEVVGKNGGGPRALDVGAGKNIQSTCFLYSLWPLGHSKISIFHQILHAL